VIRYVNTATRPSRLRRFAAVLVTGALVVLGSIVATSPAAAATGDVTGGTATWGISTYLNAGTFGRPSPLTSGYIAPATYNPTTKLSSWGNATGHVNADGSAALAFSGTSVNFTATGGGWLKLADVQAILDASGNGSVTALVSYGLAPGTYPAIAYDPAQAPQRGPERITIVTLAGNTSGATLTETSASWLGLAGTWNSALLAYLQGDGSTIPAWGYAATITNDATVAGPRTALPFAFAVSFQAAPKSFNAGTATWGISTYLNAGNFGRPSPLTSAYIAPAAYNPTTKLSSWGNATGTLNGDGSATLAYSGTSVNFTATGGGWLKLADVQATLDPSGNGSVSALVSYGLAPGVYPNISYSAAQAPQRGPERVTIVTLAGNSSGPTLGTGTASWTGLAGTWSTAFLAYLRGNGSSIPAWDYAATITNDATVAGPRTALPFSFSLSSVPLISTTTALTVNPASPVLAGTDVALAAVVTPAVAGTVTFANGATVLGTVPVTAGAASFTITGAAAGDYALTATFAPTDTAHYAGSAGALAYTVSAPVPASPGSLIWGVKQSLQSYVLGGGSISTASGAGYNGVRFSFPQTVSSSFNHESATGSSSYGGSATFAYPAHGFSIGLANPRVVLSSATAGTLYMDVTYNGSTTRGIAFATLGLGSATSTGTTTTFSNVSATLTAAGATAFQGFYTAGTALDPMSFVIGAPSTGFASTTKAAAVNEPDATPPATEGITAGSDAPIEGEQFTATASGFAPNETDIFVVIYSEPMLLDTVTADKNGLVSWTGTLPTGLTGEHTLTFQGSVDKGIVLDIAPAAATTAAEGCVVESGDLTWGFKESFRSYISGSIANGEWTVADGATYETPSFGFSGATGAYDAASASGLVSFVGSINFTGHGGVLDTTVANPQIRFDDESTASVILDVSGTTQEGESIDQQDVEFATVDLAAATVTSADGVVTITDAPAELTADGSAAFGTYGAGEALDPITLSFTTADCAAAPVEEPAVVDDEPASSATDLTWLWIVLAVLLALAVIATVVIIARRRKA